MSRKLAKQALRAARRALTRAVWTQVAAATDETNPNGELALEVLRAMARAEGLITSALMELGDIAAGAPR